MNTGPKLALIGMAALVLFAWISVSLQRGSPAFRAAEPEPRNVLRESSAAPPELLSPARSSDEVADERVAVEPSVVDLEALWAGKYGDAQGLDMLQAGQELHLRVIGRMKRAHGEQIVLDESNEPELFALYREANWLLEEGTQRLRGEASAFAGLTSRRAFGR